MYQNDPIRKFLVEKNPDRKFVGKIIFTNQNRAKIIALQRNGP